MRVYILDSGIDVGLEHVTKVIKIKMIFSTLVHEIRPKIESQNNGDQEL